MLYEEDLELHFWNGESYDTTKVIQFLNFVLKNQKEIIFFTITYIEFNVNQTQVTEQAYEGESLDKVFQINDYENSSDLKNILENMLVERIVFECGDDTKKVFYTVISENSFYYSYNFKVEDGSIYEIFSNILPLYKELISIFQPKISNGGFEVVREDADRIQKESFFEGIYGYLSNEYDFNRFIDFQEKIHFGDGFIFVIKTEKNNGLLGKIMNNLKKIWN